MLPVVAVDSIAHHDVSACVDHLRVLAGSAEQFGLTKDFLLINAEAIEVNDWSLISIPFIESHFVGAQGYFLLIAPYFYRRRAKKVPVLTAIYGQVVDSFSANNLYSGLEAICGSLNEPIPQILPIHILSSAGLVNAPGGEAFLVPNGWAIPQSEDGPPLNDVFEQRHRFKKSSITCISRIFSDSSASLLLDSFRHFDVWLQIHNMEFQLHDAGHATGLGLGWKLKNQMLLNKSLRAIEDYRADGIEFEFAVRHLGLEDAALVIAANLCLRFGVDAQRSGGTLYDVDASVALLTFDRMVKSGHLVINGDGRLKFREESPEGLIAATNDHRSEAVDLTMREKQIDRSVAFQRLYDEISMGEESKSCFEEFVISPCRSIAYGFH